MTEILQAGDPAPRFEAVDQDGTAVALADFAGRWLLLYFYPRDDTPGCTIEAQEFTALAAEFAALDDREERILEFDQRWKGDDEIEKELASVEKEIKDLLAVTPKDAMIADIGCGSGRWAKHIAPLVKELHCVDASDHALNVAKNNLTGFDNCIFIHGTTDTLKTLDQKISSINNKLKNKSFLKNAPKQIVEKEKKALIDYEIELKKLNSILNSIKN